MHYTTAYNFTIVSIKLNIINNTLLPPGMKVSTQRPWLKYPAKAEDAAFIIQYNIGTVYINIYLLIYVCSQAVPNSCHTRQLLTIVAVAGINS